MQSEVVESKLCRDLGAKVRTFPTKSARSRKVFSWLEPEAEKMVNGVPLWKEAIPLNSQPSAILRARPFWKKRSRGSFQRPLITSRCVTSKLARPRSNAGLKGSVKSEEL